MIILGQIQEDIDQCESANKGRIQRASNRLAFASILGRSDSHVKPQPHCVIENKDHLLWEQRFLPYLPHYISLDISSQILANQSGCRKERYQARKWYQLTQYTLNIVRGWCFRTSAAAQDDHSTQNTIFTGQEGWAWTSRANATSEKTKHRSKRQSTDQRRVSPQPRNCHASFSVLWPSIQAEYMDRD